MNLKEIEVKPHPSRGIFRKHNIPLKIVAKALNLSYPHVVAMLSGSLQVTPKNEVKLKRLCNELERN